MAGDVTGIAEESDPRGSRPTERGNFSLQVEIALGRRKNYHRIFEKIENSDFFFFEKLFSWWQEKMCSILIR
jgi:hypothetical protein